MTNKKIKWIGDGRELARYGLVKNGDVKLVLGDLADMLIKEGLAEECKPKPKKTNKDKEL